MDDSACESLLAVPKDFQVIRETSGIHQVHYRHAGVNGLSWLVFVWSFGWIFSGAIVLLAEAAQQTPLLGAAMFVVTLGVLGVAGDVMVRLLGLFCGRKCFTVTPDGLEITSRLFLWSRRQRFPLEEIERFRQQKDRWERAGSRYGWALVVDAPRPIRLLSGQQASTCRWLGEWLSRWSGREFRSETESPLVAENSASNRSLLPPKKRRPKERLCKQRREH